MKHFNRRILDKPEVKVFEFIIVVLFDWSWKIAEQYEWAFTINRKPFKTINKKKLHLWEWWSGGSRRMPMVLDLII